MGPPLPSSVGTRLTFDVATVVRYHYLTERDPFFFFFLSLVMIINAKWGHYYMYIPNTVFTCTLSARELIMVDKEISSEAIRDIIQSLPPTLTADDVDDFFTLAHHYAQKTPQSFRKVSGRVTVHWYCITPHVWDTVQHMYMYLMCIKTSLFTVLQVLTFHFFSGLPQSTVWKWTESWFPSNQCLALPVSTYQLSGGPWGQTEQRWKCEGWTPH